MKRLRIIAIFIALTAVAMCFAFVSSATDSVPILYRNDTKYTISEYPVEVIDGKAYVPAPFFIGMKNIQYEYSVSPAGFYFRNKVTGKYFSFSTEANFIVVDSELVNIEFPIANSTVYMPLEYCSEVLSLKLEKKSDGKVQRIRITDGTEKLSFDELIELYDPTVTPKDPEEIEPELPPEQPGTPVTPTDRYLYIAITDAPNEHTESILDALESKKTKATFFLDYERIKQYPEEVIRIFVMGHEIGVTADSIDGLDKANEILYSVLNYKTLTAMLTGEVNDTIKQEALKRGYILREAHIDIASEWTDSIETARSIYNKTFEQNVTVLRLPSYKDTAAVISRILYYTSGDEYITLKAINPTVVTD